MRVRMPRMPSWRKSGACALLIIALGAAAAWSGGEAQAADNSATVVYFYPSDQEPNQEYVAQVDAAVADMQSWYGVQVGSEFAVSSVEVIRGKLTTAEYAEPWVPILRELGYWCGTGVHLIIIHQSIVPGEVGRGGYAGGGSCSNPDDGGTAMLTERVLDITLGRCNPADWWCSIGPIPHELGHVFALSHSDCTSVMLCWWDYPNVGLTDVEVQSLASSPIFSLPAGGGTDDTPDGTSDGTGDGTGDEPDTVAPMVKIVKPSDSAVVRGRWLRVRAEGSDNVRVAVMALYIDSQLVFTTEVASLDHKWDMRGVARGSSLTVTVKAFDEAGNSSVAEVSVSK